MNKGSILIVDDNIKNLQLAGSILNKHNYQTFYITDSTTVFDNVMKNMPDLILLDIQMPGIDGFEICKKLKANPKTSTIPVIFLTAMIEEKFIIKGFSMGGADYLSKPFNSSELLARVQTHIELYRIRHNLELLIEQKTEELLSTQNNTIETITSVAEFRDPETGGHIKRCKLYMKTLAEYLFNNKKYADILDRSYIEILIKTTPLHDIGKIVIPDTILLKPGKLTKKEFEIVKTHTTAGVKIINSIMRHRLDNNMYLSIAAEIALNHHEKWNGAGYPNGISTNQIPLSARLMAVIDVYEALTSKRVYKEAFSHEKALQIILDGKEKDFDPSITDAFISIEKKIKEILLSENI
jgi:putative two-component system response regulator